MTMIDQQLGAAAVPKEVWQDSAELHRCLNCSDDQEGIRRIGIGRVGSFLTSVADRAVSCRLAADAGARVTGPDALPQGSSSYLRSRRPY